MLFVVTAIALQLSVPQAAPPPSDVAALVRRARAARLQQEAALAGYEAVARQRLSVEIGLASGSTSSIVRGAVGAMRLAARHESVARVGWRHDIGAWGEVLASRSVAPIVGGVTPAPDPAEVALVLPYYPGRDRLWPTSEMRLALPQLDGWIEHPLDDGADSIYTFSIGDTLDIHLPDHTLIPLREIRVRPRRPSSRLIVGSLWIDATSGSLVRIAYRPSLPVDLWPLFENEIGRDDRDKIRKFGPFTGVIREIIVDHALFEGRFWLPTARIATGEGTAVGARMKVSVAQAFEYAHVVATPPGQTVTIVEPPLDIDRRTGRVRRGSWAGVDERARRCRATGDSTAARWAPDSLARDSTLSVIHMQGIRMHVLFPCDETILATSPLLPASIYSPGEAAFPTIDFAALRRDAEDALSMDKQAEWTPLPTTFHYGLDAGMLRYNRVEGVSAGVMADRVLGNGYTTGGLVRLGIADWQPLAEAYVERGDVVDAARATVYRRLATANDWGNPLGLGASIAAAAFGRDDGFYYRTLGGELTGSHRGTGDRVVTSWRVFGERQTSAPVGTQGSFAHALHGTEFLPNIDARGGGFVGGGATVAYVWGLDPRGVILSGDTRVESATGAASYGRAMTELSIARGLGDRTQLTLSGAAGSSVGQLPPQRLWYLGGAYTVHGNVAGAERGDAFWLGRAEVAKGNQMVRPIVFGDIGWAGPRAEWSRARQPMSGAGAGLAILEGLIRFDVARGIQPTHGWRADFYFDIK